MGNIKDFSKDSFPDEPDHIQSYRSLTSEEIEMLVKNNNTAESWDNIRVTGNFDAGLVRSCEFWGQVYLGDLTANFLEYNELRLPVGLQNCTIISCHIGNNVVLRNVHHISHYIVGNEVILVNIDEMITVDHAKFGNGTVKEGENEDVRIWLEIGNENGGRRVLPFTGMLPADAYIWSRYRENKGLQKRLIEMTDRQGNTRRGFYGRIGDHSVIKDSRIIKDVLIGSDCYIKGANKLKNLTINSSAQEPSQIGEGVELVNGIVGYGNRIFYGIKAVRFVTGRNVQLKYGARLINSYLGCNSTVSCCEILNNLIFPFHEQHHNNSFLIASTLLGQSNIAAGATIGSNHNSRAADGEILAGRGFWPGLVSSFKHNSRFASFTLVARGNYPWEMNIKLPFSLMSLSPDQRTIQVMPGYWFKHNMYALTRNSAKFQKRDLRITKEQNIEYDYLAPDTAEEMVAARRILLKALQKSIPERDQLAVTSDRGKKIESEIELQLPDMVKGRNAIILKPVQGFHLYGEMLKIYGARELKKAVEEAMIQGESPAAYIAGKFQHPCRSWVNIGGQIIPEDALLKILKKISAGTIKNWSELHAEYDGAWANYPLRRRDHGIFCALEMHNKKIGELTDTLVAELLTESLALAKHMLRSAIDSRTKDFTNPFRQATFRNPEEMTAVVGTIKDNSFLNDFKRDTARYCREVRKLVQQIQ
jgi:hypothetical protein